MNAARLLSTSVLCLALASPAFSYQVRDQEAPYGASQSEINEALRDCQRDEISIAICEWSSYRNSLKELRSIAKEVDQALSSDKVRLAYFKRSQKAWEQFRNADCDLDASSADGGSMVSGLIYSCRTILTNQRVELLRHFVGTLDAGSPVPLLLYEHQ
ncbi:lysozyme inhibitor LprI family protein [Cupriavidus basilensis]|uniref:lysozyme inhibitor LprI family protein n=1 Tax=Cupriavidus basilensis TaxID=68895 RepID=UPI0009E4C8CF